MYKLPEKPKQITVPKRTIYAKLVDRYRDGGTRVYREEGTDTLYYMWGPTGEVRMSYKGPVLDHLEIREVGDEQ